MYSQWDTAGHERFRSLTTSYYRGVNSIVIVFSITDKESFEHIDIWLKEIDNHAKENVLKFLVGNKCDLNEQRVISTEEAIALAKKYNIEYIETSAKDTINTDELFERAIKTFLEKNKFLNNEVKNINIGTTEIQSEEKKCDC